MYTCIYIYIHNVYVHVYTHIYGISTMSIPLCILIAYTDTVHHGSMVYENIIVVSCIVSYPLSQL